MSISKKISTIVCATFFALLYVHQQVELVKISYKIGQKEKVLREMLDRNEKLGYNIQHLEAPSRLEKALSSNNIEISFPARGQVVRLLKSDYDGHETLRVKATEKQGNILKLFDFLGQIREAQARER